MSKFVAAITEVPGVVNISVEDFQKSVVTKGGLKSAIEYHVDQAIVEFCDEEEIFIVDSQITIAQNVVNVLNASYAERAESMEAAMTPSYTFAGTAGVAFGGEVVSTNDTAEAAIHNIENNKSINQPKGEVKTMSNQTANQSIKNLVAAGVNDSDALAIAMKLKEAAAKKDVAGANQIKSDVKENVQMNARRGSATINKEEEVKNQTAGFVFGGAKQNNNGGNDMNTQTQAKEETKGAVQSNRRGSGYTGGTVDGTQAPAGNQPSFRFNGQTQDTIVDATGLTGFDASDRDADESSFGGAWYFDAERYPALKDFDFYFENRRALPANPYGLTKINFLNPKDKKVVDYDNKYEIVVELCFGKGVNARIKLTRVTEQMKADKEAKGYKASKSEWSTGNIKWVERQGKLAPRYAMSIRNGIALNIKCACGKNHTVHTAYATTCKCGKKYDAVKMAPVGESAGLNFSEYQSDWSPVVFDNFNVKVHKDVLALALACAAKERGMDISALVGEESK